MSVGSEVSYLGIDPIEVNKATKEAAYRYIDLINKEYPNAYAFSTDIYIDDKDNVGLFEFSGEYGFAAVGFDDLRNSLIKSIMSLVKTIN